MKKILTVCASLFILVTSFSVQAEDKKTTAENLVKAAIAHYEKVGQEQAFKDFAVKGSEFNHGEFYVFIQSVETDEMVFHGANSKLIGRNLMGLKDPTGKEFVKAYAENTKKDGSAWTSYQWVHPETKKLAPKQSYTEKHAGLIFGTGYYE
ncbi:cache domain-containing protein [Sneathiella glossodoripedis]|uniref:cache domain-containing protein n=1 Tax=Sneathiella glossodoripedis TaxID=418853 RepID=UPI000471F24F|nr:cache domain-containing protein [Sneathiella glossodoripedis]